MSILNRFFPSKTPVARVRVCRECGMPVGEHKDWCAVVLGQQAQQNPQEATDGQ